VYTFHGEDFLRDACKGMGSDFEGCLPAPEQSFLLVHLIVYMSRLYGMAL